MYVCMHKYFGRLKNRNCQVEGPIHIEYLCMYVCIIVFVDLKNRNCEVRVKSTSKAIQLGMGVKLRLRTELGLWPKVMANLVGLRLG